MCLFIPMLNLLNYLMRNKGENKMTKATALWHIENLPEGADVKVHYLHKDEELTISEICNTYPEDKDTQFHFIVASERKKWNLRLE